MASTTMLDTFCPDTLLWRNKSDSAGMNEMFLSSIYDGNLDSCRVAVSLIPNCPIGQYVMLSILDDDDIDIPVRKVAFALASGMLGVKPKPIYQTRELPLYSQYQNTVRNMLSNLCEDARMDAVVTNFRDRIVSKLPIFPISKKALAQLKDITMDIFGVNKDQLGTIPAWVGVLEINTSLDKGDLTKRQPTVSRNYYCIHPAPVKHAIVAEHTDHAPGAPTPDDIDEVNKIAADCLNRAKQDPKWLSTPSTRCMVLLLVMTVRNAMRKCAPWPSRPELLSRLQSVKKLLLDTLDGP